MKRHYLGIIALGALGLQNVYAEDIKANENDTIKTYNMGEVIVTSSTKETNNLRTVTHSVKHNRLSTIFQSFPYRYFVF